MCICATAAILIDRPEHNIAVLQLKKRLKFGEDSKYNPVCLPQCDFVCRTRTGLAENELEGSSVIVSRSTWEHNLETISKSKCESLISNNKNSNIYAYMGLKYYLQTDTIRRFVKYYIMHQVMKNEI